MSTSPSKAELDELFAPSVESMIAKGQREEFPWDRGTLTTHLPLDPTTLEVLFRVNLPKVILRRDCNFEDVQSDGYVNAVRTMSDALRAKDCKARNEYEPAKSWYGNYSLENRQATAFIWVRFTTVVELLHTIPEGSGTGVVIDVRGLATALDKAMKDHEGPASTVPKGCIYGASIPSRFTVDKMELLSFEFSPSTDSHREFVVKQEEMAYEVNKTFNHRPVEGITASGNLENQLQMTCRKVKAKAQLVIRIAHQTSMWPTERVFELQCFSRFEGSDTDEKPDCLKSLGSLESLESSDSLGGNPGDEPAGSWGLSA
ncbi:hypothetical protein QBC32DRAFT_210557 [Pseudoneurospora amorphoporcata]|uniref:Uncharacterized protein n=1 Tax=Pseudoneurospora amorphoporcata TaxID=241081 RepID=A0AAN6SH50_9PEZI|nr:hypothetical protein QBC32DRAFT_210557 [Pseudoneurospora amorphoporcata]